MSTHKIPSRTNPTNRLRNKKVRAFSVGMYYYSAELIGNGVGNGVDTERLDILTLICFVEVQSRGEEGWESNEKFQLVYTMRVGFWPWASLLSIWSFLACCLGTLAQPVTFAGFVPVLKIIINRFTILTWPVYKIPLVYSTHIPLNTPKYLPLLL